MNRNHGTSALLFFVYSLLPVLALADCPVAGTYSARGTNPEQKKYEGFVVITKGSGNTCNFAWTLPTEKYTGSGELKDGRLSVNWGAPDPVIYVVESDGELRGTWANGEGTEELIP